MKFMTVRRATVSILTGLLVIATAGAAAAGALSGSKGDVRFWPSLPGNSKDPCTKAFNEYVAAGGHSAYATTPYARVRSLYIVCGTRLNAPSQKAAEEAALKSCQAGVRGHRFTTGGACEIAASK